MSIVFRERYNLTYKNNWVTIIFYQDDNVTKARLPSLNETVISFNQTETVIEPLGWVMRLHDIDASGARLWLEVLSTSPQALEPTSVQTETIQDSKRPSQQDIRPKADDATGDDQEDNNLLLWMVFILLGCVLILVAIGGIWYLRRMNRYKLTGFD